MRVFAALCLGATSATVGAVEPLVIAQEPTQFDVLVNRDVAIGFDWLDGAVVTLSVDDPATPSSPDFTATAVAGVDPLGSLHNVYFDFADEFDVRPGHVVTMDDGQTLISHVVQTVEVTEVDLAADTVSGTADPGDLIEVLVTVPEGLDPVPVVLTMTQPDGKWVASFAGVFDLMPGAAGHAVEHDPDVHASTSFWWETPDEKTKPVTREHIVQVFPDDVPDPSDRNIVCDYETPAEHAYFFVSGSLEIDLLHVASPGVDRTRAVGAYVDVTAVRSDDLFLDPEELNGTHYMIEGEGVSTITESPDGSVASTLRAAISIIDPVTGEVVDSVDFFVRDRTGEDEVVVYDRGNCG